MSEHEIVARTLREVIAFARTQKNTRGAAMDGAGRVIVWAHNRLIEMGESVVTEIPSPEEIEAAKTPAGGWTRATLASWGVAWPPKRGWRSELNERYWRSQGVCQ